MSSDPKATPTPPEVPAKPRDVAIRIFAYPKVIFMFPTLVAALVCGVGMSLIGNDTSDPLKQPGGPAAAAPSPSSTIKAEESPAVARQKHERFVSPQNLLGVLFLGIFAFNLLIMALDFPRFTVVAILLMVFLTLFILLWIGAYFDYDLMRPARTLMGTIFTVANSGFYFMMAGVLTLIFAVVYFTRYLDYWEILPNEILHHHGPLSDLERYPTMNLKFDKEIPDVFEFFFLGSGRLVLHVSDERKAIVLENVLFINSKEEGLKRLMSRMNVRIMSDQDAAGI